MIEYSGQVAAAIAALALFGAAVADIARYEIPDTLSIIILAAAVVYGLVTPGFGWGRHTGALGIMFALGLLIFAKGWMGGGDVKVLVATAAWAGLPGLAVVLVAVALAGGILALVLMLARGGFAVAGVCASRAPKLFQRGAPLPYAVAILCGALWWAWGAYPIR